MFARLGSRWLVATGLALIVVALCTSGRPADWLRQMIGGNAQSAVTYELRADEPLPTALDRIVQDRLPHYQTQLTMLTPNTARVVVRGSQDSEHQSIQNALGIPGNFWFAAVIENSTVALNTSRFLAERGGTDACAGISTEVDRWTNYAGAARSESFVIYRGIDDHRAALAAVRACVTAANPSELWTEPGTSVNGPTLGAGPNAARLFLERDAPDPRSKDPRPSFRTYWVATDNALSQADIEDAKLVFDPNTNAPQVLVTFTQSGAAIFGDFTAAISGGKAAVIRDGVVASAPIINGAIRGGIAVISMGAGPSATVEREAAALAASLRSHDPLPASISVTQIDARQASVWLTVVPWLLGATMFVGFLVAAPVLQRRWPVMHWSQVTSAASPASPFASNVFIKGLAVTLGVPSLLYYAAHSEWLAIPGSGDMARYGNPDHINVLMLGIGPALTAYPLVELVAFLVPRWRTKRIGTAHDRRDLDRAVVVVALVLAAVQSYFVASYLASLGEDLNLHINRLVVVASVTAGSVVFPLLANFISRHGLCNGWLVLLAMRAVPSLWTWAKPLYVSPTLWTALLIVPGLVLLTFAVVRSTLDQRRLPRVGMVVPSIALYALSLLTLVTLANNLTLSQWIDAIHQRPVWVDIGFTVVACSVLLFKQKNWGVELAWYVGLVATAWLATGVADMLTITTIIGVTLAAFEIARSSLGRARLGQRTLIGEMHDPDQADRYAAALRGAGITVHVENQAYRSMFRGLTAFCPIAVWVPTAQRDAATAVALPALPRDVLVAIGVSH